MPLIHSKTPKAFKKNVEEMVEHGHPIKQALAASYHEKRSAEHSKMASGGCMGPECKGCSSESCYAHGGPTRDFEKGVHKSTYADSGESYAGHLTKETHKELAKDFSREAKNQHIKVLDEMKSMPKPKLMAEGGEVDSDPDHDGDSELHEAMGHELMEALDRKDKKGILQAIEAIVLSMKHEE